MGTAIDTFLKGLGSPSIAAYSGAALPGTPPADTATADEKAKFNEAVRKYQLDQKAYNQYADEYRNRVAGFNIYADPQFSTTQPQFMRNQPRPSQPTIMGQPDVPPPPPPPAPLTQLRAPTYGAISQFANLTPQQQADLYRQQREIGYTDADIRKATAAQIGTPSEEMMANIYKVYPQYAPTPISPLTPAASAISPTVAPSVLAQPELYNYSDRNAVEDKEARDAASSGGGGGAARGGYIKGYANGGPVRTHYQTGGLTGGDNLSELENFYVQELANNPRRPIGSRLFAPPLEMPLQGPINVGAMSANVGEGGTPQPRPRQEDNLATLDQYYRDLASSANSPAARASANAVAANPRSQQQGSMYGAELRDARARAAAETEAFNNMLQNMMNSPESQQASKAEMYFRLASAFGSPTRTGKMGETLSNVGQQMSEYARGQRASEADRRKLMLEGQKLRMETSRADLNALRALAQEELRDQRQLQTALIQAGRPQSRYGQAAVDMGLTPGTPEFNQYVRERAQQDVENANETIQLRLQAAELARRVNERRENELTPAEVRMRRETEDSVAGARQSLADIQEAYRLNENSFAGGLLDRGRRALLEAAGSDSPIVVNTRRLENLLGQQGLEKLKATFGGNPTEGERRILLDLEGIGSKSIEERKQIIQRAYTVLRERVAREERRLNDIISGRYRERSETTPRGGE